MTTMLNFQLSHKPLEKRPFPIVTKENGNITGVWGKKYSKVIGFCFEYRAGEIDITFEKFALTKQSLSGMYIVVADADGNFITLFPALEGAYVIRK